MGIPKCFQALGCFEVTFILRDFKTVTGKIVGLLDEDRKKFCDDDKKDDHKKDECDKCDDHKKEVDKFCCKPKVDVKVDIDDKCDFILVELTRDAETVLLQEVEINGGLEIEWVNVEFPEGSCIALNVCDIIYAGVNAEIDEEEVELFNGAVAAPVVTTTPS